MIQKILATWEKWLAIITIIGMLGTWVYLYGYNNSTLETTKDSIAIVKADLSKKCDDIEKRHDETVAELKIDIKDIKNKVDKIDEDVCRLGEHIDRTIHK